MLAVGHSYGGAIISNAVQQDSVLTTVVQPSQYPTGHGSGTATELIIDPARFRAVFTADLPQLESDV